MSQLPITGIVLLNAKQATGIDSPGAAVAGYPIKYIDIVAAGLAAGDSYTVKIVGSNQDDCPDFTAASSTTNLWTYARCTIKDSNTTIVGSTGLTLSSGGTYDNGTYTLNVEGQGFKWINAIITAKTDADDSASISAFLSVYDD